MKPMFDEYDVVVIGAGPGGSLAARDAAKGGARVLLIEKRQEIGDPVRCAEGINAVRALEYIDIPERMVCSTIRKCGLIVPDGRRLVLESKNVNLKGYILDRKIFDRYLAEEAARAGAEILVKTTATGLIKEDGKICGVTMRHLDKTFSVRCRIVIGADGVESKVGRWAGIDTSLGLDYIESGVQYLMSGIKFDSDCIDIYMGNETAPSGYAWVFPKGEDKANVGIGLLGSRIRDGGRPIDYLNKFVEKHFPEGKILEMNYGGIPVTNELKQLVADNIMLVGDAGRLTDPLTGGGIVNAIVSGSIAGKTAAEAIKAGDCSEKMLKKYAKEWHDVLGKFIDRDNIIKEYFVSISDEEANRIAEKLKDADFSNAMELGNLIKLVSSADKKLLLKLGANEIKHLF